MNLPYVEDRRYQPRICTDASAIHHFVYAYDRTRYIVQYSQILLYKPW